MLVFGWWALLGLVLVCAGLIGLTAFRYGLLPTLVRGAPYMPTHMDLVEQMIRCAKLRPTDCVVDLGSGDGRLVFAAARAGVKDARGYEIDAWQVWKARRIAKRLCLQNAQFEWGTFWKVDVSKTDVIFVYGLPPYMQRLSDKLRAELPGGARVVSLLYQLPGWPATQENEGVYVYEKL